MRYGDALSTEDRAPGVVPVMSSGGVTGRHDRTNTSSPVIVIGRKGSHGSVWWSDEAAFVIDTAYSIDANNSAADLRWLYYLLGSLRLGELTTDVGVPGLSRETAYDSPVPVLPRGEQRRIAEFLDDRVARIDQIVKARRRQEAAILERFEAMRAYALLCPTENTRVTDLPWAPLVSRTWPIRRLSQVARMGTGHTPSRSEPKYWIDCGIPWLTTSDVHRFRKDEIDEIDETAVEISELGLANSSAVVHPAGTVALSRTASAGFSILMKRAMATSQDFVTWTCGPDLLPPYLLHLLRTMRPYLLGFLAMGSTHKTIYFPDLMDLRIPLPPTEDQSAAVELVQGFAHERTTAMAALRRQVELLVEYRHSLISAAVSGELDVTTAGSGIPK